MREREREQYQTSLCQTDAALPGPRCSLEVLSKLGTPQLCYENYVWLPGLKVSQRNWGQTNKPLETEISTEISCFASRHLLHLHRLWKEGYYICISIFLKWCHSDMASFPLCCSLAFRLRFVIDWFRYFDFWDVSATLRRAPKDCWRVENQG